MAKQSVIPEHKISARSLRLCAFAKGFLLILTIFSSRGIFAQDENEDFKNYQLSCSRVSDAAKKFSDTLAGDFRRKNLVWPPKDIYLRAFKSQNELELWARNNEASEYKLVKTLHICAISGALGPKRTQGDRQVPEGYYFIKEFNPKSDFYLALGINYPNYSDSMMGHGNLGGDIYIHGGCVTVGCMPMTDDGIKELYTVCLNAYMNGEEYIPVHIFPTRLTKNGLSYLNREYPRDPQKQQFWNDLKAGYEYFEKYHKLLPVMYSPDGRYTN